MDTNAPESDTNAPESETDAPQADEPPSILPVYSGTPDVSWYTGDKTEYTITTAEQLAGINQLRKNSEGSITFEGVTIKLGADIAINGGTMQEMITNGEANTPWVNVASTYLFKGTFDGQGHTVYGLYVKLSTAGVQGMFGALGGNATIKNLKLKNALVTGPKAADKTVLGTLASKISGDDASVTISNVEINSTVKENGYSINQVGGFIGAISDAGTLTMDNCIFRGSLTTSGRSAGGLVGSATNLKATVNLKKLQKLRKYKLPR